MNYDLIYVHTYYFKVARAYVLRGNLQQLRWYQIKEGFTNALAKQLTGSAYRWPFVKLQEDCQWPPAIGQGVEFDLPRKFARASLIKLGNFRGSIALICTHWFFRRIIHPNHWGVLSGFNYEIFLTKFIWDGWGCDKEINNEICGEFFGRMPGSNLGRCRKEKREKKMGKRNEKKEIIWRKFKMEGKLRYVIGNRKYNFLLRLGYSRTAH